MVIVPLIGGLTISNINGSPSGSDAFKIDKIGKFLSVTNEPLTAAGGSLIDFTFTMNELLTESRPSFAVSVMVVEPC